MKRDRYSYFNDMREEDVVGEAGSEQVFLQPNTNKTLEHSIRQPKDLKQGMLVVAAAARARIGDGRTKYEFDPTQLPADPCTAAIRGNGKGASSLVPKAALLLRQIIIGGRVKLQV